MADLKTIALRGLGGEFRLNEPMRRHTSWRTGGVADRAYFPRDLDDLTRFIQTIPRDERVYLVGLGSNLLVRDGGIRGTVIFTHWALRELRIAPAQAGSTSDPARTIYAEAGVASPKLARFAANHDLRGAEFLAGVPGTVGGALAMNAGCYGSETWDFVASVVTLGRDGRLVQRTRADFDIGYRSVVRRFPQEEWFVAACFELSPGDGAQSRSRISGLLRSRIATQPLDRPNAGSVFRNPPGDHAARLIESCGLKGRAIGGAVVSPKHANFIVNMGDATSAQIEALIDEVQETVKRQTGVELEREVRIIGEHA